MQPPPLADTDGGSIRICVPSAPAAVAKTSAAIPSLPALGGAALGFLAPDAASPRSAPASPHAAGDTVVTAARNSRCCSPLAAPVLQDSFAVRSAHAGAAAASLPSRRSASSATIAFRRRRIAFCSAPANPFLFPSAAIASRISSKVIAKRSAGACEAVAFMEQTYCKNTSASACQGKRSHPFPLAWQRAYRVEVTLANSTSFRG